MKLLFVTEIKNPCWTHARIAFGSINTQLIGTAHARTATRTCRSAAARGSWDLLRANFSGFWYFYSWRNFHHPCFCSPRIISAWYGNYFKPWRHFRYGLKNRAHHTTGQCIWEIGKRFEFLICSFFSSFFSPRKCLRSFFRSSSYRQLTSTWTEDRMEREGLSYCREQYEWMIEEMEIYRDLEKNSGMFTKLRW